MQLRVLDINNVNENKRKYFYSHNYFLAGETVMFYYNCIKCSEYLKRVYLLI